MAPVKYKPGVCIYLRTLYRFKILKISLKNKLDTYYNLLMFLSCFMISPYFRIYINVYLYLVIYRKGLGTIYQIIVLNC